MQSRTKRVYVGDEVERMALYKQGLLDKEIAERLHYTEGGINAWRQRRGLPGNGGTGHGGWRTNSTSRAKYKVVGSVEG
jgi:hypothetical protein